MSNSPDPTPAPGRPVNDAIILEQLPSAAIVVDQRGLIRYANAEAGTLFDYDPGDLMELSVDEILPDSLGPAQEDWAQTDSGTVVGPSLVAEREVLARRRDGASFPASLAVRAVGGQGETHILATVRDLSEERVWQLQLLGVIPPESVLELGAPTRQNLFRDRQRLAATLAVGHVGTYLWHVTTDTLELDERAREICGSGALTTGVSLEVLRSRLHPEDLAAFNETMRQVLDSGGSFDVTYRIREEGGQERWLLDRGLAVRGASGEVAYVVGAVMDISEHKRAEAERARSLALATEAEALYRTLFDNLADGVVLFDEDGRYIEVSQSYCRMSGYSREEFLGRRIGMVVDLDEAQRLDARARMSHGEVRNREATLTRKDGEHWPVEMSTHAVDLGGRLLFMATVRDLRERKAYEQLQREFLAMVTHDLRNPIASLLGWAQIAQRYPDRVSRGLKMIEDEARHLERLVSDLMEATRTDAQGLELRREPIDLLELAHTCVERIQGTAPTHVMTVDCARESLVGEWDADRLEQVLENLLSNAVKYAPAGGNIRVTLDADEAMARVAVSDEGIGIDPERLPHIFERFYRAEHGDIKGLGLGLANARAIVEGHGGRIWVASRPDHGSTFTFELPLRAPEGEQASDE